MNTTAKGSTVEEYDEIDFGGCECEQDWNCPLHQGKYTWIETRYQGMDDEGRY